MVNIQQSGSGVKRGRVEVEAQGNLLKVVRRSGAHKRDHGGGGTKLPPTCPSDKSIRKLKETFARLDPPDPPGLLFTATYGGAQEDLPWVDEFERHRRNLCKRFRYHLPDLAGIWVKEFESSGERDYHPHLHVALWGVDYVDKGWIRDQWNSVIGDRWASSNSTRIERQRSLVGIGNYLAGYLSKSHMGLSYATYLAKIGGVDLETGELWDHSPGGVSPDGLVYVGRWWGIHNREGLPWGERVDVGDQGIVEGDWFYDFKRAGRRKWAGVNAKRGAGFTLYVEDPEQWVELAFEYASSIGEEKDG